MIDLETITSLDELIRSKYFARWQESRLGNNLFVNDPDRAERIHKEAERGSCGSFHAEIINDWRECLCNAVFDDVVSADKEDKISKEIAACEEAHEKAGTLFTLVG